MVYLLDNPIRTHPWGSHTAIPELLGTPPTGQPQAELWLSGYQSTPSIARTPAGPVPLDELIRRDPAGALGADVLDAVGARLPYLLKVLAVERPLSIQAHPTSELAAAGYAAENAAGVPADSPERSYHDPFHKPELVVALSDFVALLGFRIPTEAEELIGRLNVPGLADVLDLIRTPDGLPETVQWLLTLPAERATSLAQAVAAACRDRLETEPFTILAGIGNLFPGDRGVLLALLLQPIRLRAGDACAVPAGTPHCYLRGLVVEAQAASDNTLRAGLTPKHIDVPELLSVLRYAPGLDPRLAPASESGVDVFELPGVQDVRLTRIRLSSDPVVVAGSLIALVTDGWAVVGQDGERTKLGRGGSVFAPADRGEVTLVGDGTAFVATAALGPVGRAR